MILKSRIGYQFSAEFLDEFHTFNCLSDSENSEKFGACTVQDAKQAIELATKAHRVFKKSTVEFRSKFLTAIANELDQQRNALVEMYCKESSLSAARGNSELDRTIFQLRSYGDYLLDPSWNRPIVSEIPNSPHKISTELSAIGPVAVFGASNFPFAYSTAGGDTASALAAGCPVIVKAHSMHAGTSYLVAECIVKVAQEVGAPEGVFSHLLDNGYEIGEELVSNENVKAVGFTGSIKGGRALMDLAAKRLAPIPVFAEMGSVNPVVFFNEELEKNSDLWIDKFAQSIATDAGQFCTKPGLLFVPSTELGGSFLKDLGYQLSVTEPKCHLHPKLFNAFKDQVEETFKWIPTKAPYHSQPVLRIVDAKSFLNDYNFYEEFFGPQAIAVQYESIEQLIVFLDKLTGQLTATVIATPSEIDSKTEVLDLLKEKAGRIIINGVPTGVAVCDAMVHGGTYPAASDSRFTAVGTQSMYRFLRPIAVQKI